MDSDHDSGDDWVVLGSCASSDDDHNVLALSSGCATPVSDSDSDATALVLAAAVAAYPDDDEGIDGISDAEEDDDPSPARAQPRPLSGLFHHNLTGAVTYVAFDPVFPHLDAAAANNNNNNKQLVPDPTFSRIIPDDVVRALASTRGLVCLRGAAEGTYYIANPLTFAAAQLPRPSCNHGADDPAVVITFDLDDGATDDDEGDHGRSFYHHYRIVVAFRVGDEGIYAFETFSSRTWAWTVGNAVAAAENVLPSSGVGVLGCAFWRTTMGFFLCYEPVSGSAELLPAPMEATHWSLWELGEMEGELSAACMDERLDTVVVVCLDFESRNDTGGVTWTLKGHFEGGCLRGRQHVTLLRSQGKAEVVMWDRCAETVVAMDLEGRTTRTIAFVPPGTGYYADFIPYVSSLAAVSASGTAPHAEYRTTAGNQAMAVDVLE